MKTAFNMKQKAFLIVFKRLLIKPIKTTFLEGESPSLIVVISTLNYNKSGIEGRKFCLYSYLLVLLLSIVYSCDLQSWS